MSIATNFQQHGDEFVLLDQIKSLGASWRDASVFIADALSVMNYLYFYGYFTISELDILESLLYENDDEIVNALESYQVSYVMFLLFFGLFK